MPRWILALAVLAGCSIAEAAPTKSTEGETCGRTADCAGKLRCIDGVCYDAAALACQASSGCKYVGKCSPGKRKGSCIAATDLDCAPPSLACKLTGNCHAKGGRCIATSDADCKNADACDHGVGLCTFKVDRCIAVKPADCAAGCRFSGYCTIKNGSCVVGGNADCEQSDDCRRFGRCVAKGDECVATDCKNTLPCRVAGRCTLRAGVCE